MSEYTAVPSTGKLKLKGVKDGRVDKKKKKKKPVDPVADDDNSVVLRSLEEEDAKLRDEPISVSEKSKEAGIAHKTDNDADNVQKHLKTEAERKYEEQRRKRLEKRLEKEGVKTHKERVEELNKYLSNLSEHHDMPKIGPG